MLSFYIYTPMYRGPFIMPFLGWLVSLAVLVLYIGANWYRKKDNKEIRTRVWGVGFIFVLGL